MKLFWFLKQSDLFFFAFFQVDYNVHLTIFWHFIHQFITKYILIIIMICGTTLKVFCCCVCLQGCWLYILWDGCRPAAVPWLHCGRWAPPYFPIIGWVMEYHIYPTVLSNTFFFFPWMKESPFCLRDCDSITTGTPTEENWPGISSIKEFKSYNFPKYKPQPLINHAPRYCGLSVVLWKSCGSFHRQLSTSFLSWASMFPSALATGTW